MDSQLHTLPPRKRFILRQNQPINVDYTLPTKKRSQSKRPKISTVTESVTYPLPTKKRIRAFQPESVDYSICEGYDDDGGDYHLPAKKRMDSRFVVCDNNLDANADMVSVQNRKRVCAFKPDFVIDLNVEYKSSLPDDCKLEFNFGNVAIESREVYGEFPINGGYGSDDKIFNNCVEADLEVASEFGGGVEVTESKIDEVVDEVGREEKRLVEGMMFEINVNESSEVVEEKDSESDYKFNGGVDSCGNDGESDACVDSVNDGNGDIHGGDNGESEAQHLKEVTSTDGASDGDSEPEDGVICEICESTDGDSSDPIVFCDGCDLMVHANCYGNPLTKQIPEGDWFCHKCIFQIKNPLNPISCCLCSTTGGVLKATNDGRWAHIVCAVFVPEAFFHNPEGRERIDVSNISIKRWKKKCYICKKMEGCVIDCSELKCSLSFHVTCGLNEDLCIEYREGNMKKGGIVAGFCHDHTKLWKKQQQTGKFKIVAR